MSDMSESLYGVSDARIRGIASIDGGGYQEFDEHSESYTDWEFTDIGLIEFAHAIIREYESVRNKSAYAQQNKG